MNDTYAVPLEVAVKKSNVSCQLSNRLSFFDFCFSFFDKCNFFWKILKQLKKAASNAFTQKHVSFVGANGNDASHQNVKSDAQNYSTAAHLSNTTEEISDDVGFIIFRKIV